jgi:hypothetical protein
MMMLIDLAFHISEIAIYIIESGSTNSEIIPNEITIGKIC